ncbi:MAG: hypothetical protein ACFE78_10435 [Candidatus Hodarchaeota archaeon]
MISDIIRLYKLGKELGLTKKDLNKILLFDDTKRPKVNTLLLFLILFLGLILSIVIAFTFLNYVGKNTYPTGARYSTVQIKDFKKGRKNHLLAKFLRKVSKKR